VVIWEDVAGARKIQSPFCLSHAVIAWSTTSLAADDPATFLLPAHIGAYSAS